MKLKTIKNAPVTHCILLRLCTFHTKQHTCGL